MNDLQKPTPQSEVYYAVKARGYLGGWTDEQIVARQIVKLIEELGEMVGSVDANGITSPHLAWILFDMAQLGTRARAVFDNREGWDVLVNWTDLRHELADVAVPLAVAAETARLDLMRAAERKAMADVKRGVR
jgi:NTP pyrophosphatase (non-canonical NTP hydrolase)